MDAYDQTEQKHCSCIKQFPGSRRANYDIIVVCVVHQSPENTIPFIVPQPIDTMAQKPINDKVAIVKQSKMLNKPYHVVLQLKFKMTIVMAMYV